MNICNTVHKNSLVKPVLVRSISRPASLTFRDLRILVQTKLEMLFGRQSRFDLHTKTASNKKSNYASETIILSEKNNWATITTKHDGLGSRCVQWRFNLKSLAWGLITNTIRFKLIRGSLLLNGLTDSIVSRGRWEENKRSLTRE